jgi:hypothetical protein
MFRLRRARRRVASRVWGASLDSADVCGERQLDSKRGSEMTTWSTGVTVPSAAEGTIALRGHADHSVDVAGERCRSSASGGRSRSTFVDDQRT